MINIPIVYDDPFKPNVWCPNTSGLDENDIHWSHKFNRQMPWTLQAFEPLLTVHRPSEIKNLDNFIYPVLMQEPYYQVRAVQNNHHDDFGFWSYVSDPVKEALRNKKGWVYLDITMEPITLEDYNFILESLEDSSKFPNDRVVINMHHIPGFSHPKHNNLPNFLEFHYGCRHLLDHKSDYELEGNAGLLKKYVTVPDHNKAEMDFEWMGDKNQDQTYKRFCSFQMRWWKHAGAAYLLAFLDKFDLFKLGYVTADETENFKDIVTTVNGTSKISRFFVETLDLRHKEDILPPVEFVAPYIERAGFTIVTEAIYNDHNEYNYPFITEKIWRTICHKKPFVLIGQINTLSAFRELGYKTFSPYIDESYDEMDDSRRCFKAFDEAHKLIKMDAQDFGQFLKECRSTLSHNQKNFEKRLSKAYSFFNRLLAND